MSSGASNIDLEDVAEEDSSRSRRPTAEAQKRAGGGGVPEDESEPAYHRIMKY